MSKGKKNFIKNKDFREKMEEKNEETKITSSETMVGSCHTATDIKEELDQQTLDMIKRVRDQKLVSGGLDPFFIPEKDKDSKFVYFWASTDKEAIPNFHSLKEIGWKEVVTENDKPYRNTPTGGYTVDGQPGKHILMRIQKLVHAELAKIQDELNEHKRKIVYSPELLSKKEDGGRNKMIKIIKKDDFDFLNN